MEKRRGEQWRWTAARGSGSRWGAAGQHLSSVRQRRYPSTNQGPSSKGRAFSRNGGIQRGCSPCLPTYYYVRGRKKILSSPANLRLNWSEIARPISSRRWLSRAPALALAGARVSKGRKQHQRYGQPVASSRAARPLLRPVPPLRSGVLGRTKGEDVLQQRLNLPPAVR
jgi:hypothetical protein